METQTEGSTAEVATQTNMPTKTSKRKPRVKCYFCKGPHTQKDCVRRANHQHRVLQSQAATIATINTDERESECEKSEPEQWELATEDLELEFHATKSDQEFTEQNSPSFSLNSLNPK